MGSLLLSGGLRALKKKTSQKTYGGAPLLGVNGICIIGHGSSDKIAAKNGILQAVQAVEHRVNEAILDGVRKCALRPTPEGTAT